MAQLLFKLRGVPEEEIEDIRQLLAHHKIDFYETPAGKWGISMPAIWLADEASMDQANQLMEDHHQNYKQKRKLESADQQEPLISYWLNRPVTTLAYLALILFVLYMVISPFISFLERS